jgi:hypothetical protein
MFVSLLIPWWGPPPDRPSGRACSRRGNRPLPGGGSHRPRSPSCVIRYRRRAVKPAVASTARHQSGKTHHRGHREHSGRNDSFQDSGGGRFNDLIRFPLRVLCVLCGESSLVVSLALWCASGRPRNQVRAAPPLRCLGIRGLGGLLVKRRRPPRGAASRVPVLEGARRGRGAPRRIHVGLEPRSARSGARRPSSSPGRAAFRTLAPGRWVGICRFLQDLKHARPERPGLATRTAAGPGRSRRCGDPPPGPMDIGPAPRRLDPGRRFNSRSPAPSATRVRRIS